MLARRLLARLGAARRAGAAAGAAGAAGAGVSAALHTSGAASAKVLCVLYPDPLAGYPPSYARDSIPVVAKYPDGTPAPAVHVGGGTLLGCVSGGLGLRDFLKTQGHELIVTSDKCVRVRCVRVCARARARFRWRSARCAVLRRARCKFLHFHSFRNASAISDARTRAPRRPLAPRAAARDGPDSVVERELPDTDILITTPFWPAYLDERRLAKAEKLKLHVTAGVGSDHVDLAAAARRGVTVAEATYSNSVSVAEHAVMTILALVRNFVPAHLTAITGGWNIADLAARSYDLEHMAVGTIGAGRIGLAVLRRLAPFDVALHYCDRRRLPGSVERALGLTYHATPEEMLPHCDVVTINAPLHTETEALFDAKLIARMKRGTYLVNTARAKARALRCVLLRVLCMQRRG
jgi:phosphoglycerate dehydrogenase-like enzyme